MPKPKASDTTGAHAVAHRAAGVRALVPVGNVLVIYPDWEALAGAITTQDSAFFHHLGGGDWCTLRGAFGREITLSAHRPKRVAGYAAVVEFKD